VPHQHEQVALPPQPGGFEDDQRAMSNGQWKGYWPTPCSRSFLPWLAGEVEVELACSPARGVEEHLASDPMEVTVTRGHVEPVVVSPEVAADRDVAVAANLTVEVQDDMADGLV
jgi:hypothetical protein